MKTLIILHIYYYKYQENKRKPYRRKKPILYDNDDMIIFDNDRFVSIQQFSVYSIVDRLVNLDVDLHLRDYNIVYLFIRRIKQFKFKDTTIDIEN